MPLARADLAGGWCWFHGSRAVSWNGHTVIGYVRPTPTGVGGTACIAVIRQGGQHAHECALEEWPVLDDHNVPALLPLTDELLLTAHTGHQETTVVVLTCWRATEAVPIQVWCRRIPLPGPTTYATLLPDPGGGVRLVTRVTGLGQVLLRIPLAAGDNDLRAAVLIPAPLRVEEPRDGAQDGTSRGRPYAVYRQLRDRTWFAVNEGHPRDHDNGVWCGYIDGDRIADAEGAVVRELAWVHPLRLRPLSDTGVSGLTCVRRPRRDSAAWVHDLSFDADGRPLIAYSARRPRDWQGDGSGVALDYEVSHLTADGTWQSRVVADAGTALYAKEAHYAGGIAINPADPTMVVLSTNRDPRAGIDGEPEPTWSLFVADLGSDALTFQRWPTPAGASTIRPVFSAPAAAGNGHALAYLHGDYRSFNDFDLRIAVDEFTRGLTCFDGPPHVDLEFPLDQGSGLAHAAMEVLRSYLAGSREYLEYGAGSSTLAALDVDGLRITSVDSHPRLLTALTTLAARRPSTGCFTALQVPFDVVGDWGRPLGMSAVDLMRLGWSYAHAPGSLQPDLVLIDGRFRAACFLRVAARATTPVTVLWDDYADRPSNHWIEEFAAPDDVTGRIAVFHVEHPLHVPARAFVRALGLPE